MRKRIFSLLIAVATLLSAHAVEITRYVAEGGTGDGLTAENPTGNLLKVLRMSQQVDRLIVLLAPGTYNLPPLEDYNNRTEYRNVLIYGGGCRPAQERTGEMSTITGDLMINGGMLESIEFRGSHSGSGPETLDGALTLTSVNIYNCNISALELNVAEHNIISRCDIRSGSIQKHFNSYNADLEMTDCSVSGDGLYISVKRAKLERCRFEGCNKLALHLAGENYNVTDCKFVRNYGGCVQVSAITDDIAAYFTNCSFAHNSTDNQEYASCFTSWAPVAMFNCSFIDNGYDLEPRISTYHNYQGVITLSRQQSRFVNCAFYGNRQAAIYYNMERADHQNTPWSFINCLFFGNKLSYISEHGDIPKMKYCARDFGSDIPELDAEDHNIRVTKEDLQISEGYDYDLNPGEGSVLINKGKPMEFSDYNGISHLMFGGTDIGTCEYAGNWTKVTPESVTTIGDKKYVKAQATYAGKTYYSLADADYCNGNSVSKYFMLYTGDNIAPVKVLDDTHAVAFMTIDGQKVAILYRLSDTGKWNGINSMPYTKYQPVAVKTTNGWTLKEGTAASSITTKSTGKTSGRSTGKTRRGARSGARSGSLHR